MQFLRFYLVLPFLALTQINSFGQIQTRNTFKVVHEKIQENVQIEIINNELKLSHNVFERKKYYEQVSVSYASDRVYENYFTRISNLEARVSYLNKNGKRKKAEVLDIPKRSDFSGNILYNDDSYYEVSYPYVDSGSVTELSYDIEVVDPHFMRRFYFSDYYPVEEAVYTISLDKDIEIGWKIFGDQKEDVLFEKVEMGDNVNYKWTLTNGKPLTSEEGAPGYLHKATHIVVYIKKYTTPEGTFSVLNSVGDLFNWYQSFISRIKPVDNDELKVLTQEIVGEEQDQLEKARLIFNWVQDNIRYIAFEDGWRGFVPYPAAEICQKRYGDCKDMSHLIHEMLRFAGIEANHSWVGTRRLPYRYADTPCPSVDNHMVLSLVVNDSIYILDATDAYTPFGVPTSFILSKEILSESLSGGHQLYTIPSFSADFCKIEEDIQFTEIEGEVVGQGEKRIETFEYSYFHNAYGNSNTDKDEFLKTYLELGHNNFELVKAQIGDENPRTTSLIKYDYIIPNYVSSFGELSFVNLNMTKPLADKMLQVDRNYDYVHKYKKKWDNKVVFTIPDGKQITEIPEDVSFNTKYGSCTAKYVLMDKQLIYQRTITLDRLNVLNTEIEIWNSFVQQLISVYNTTIEYK